MTRALLLLALLAGPVAAQLGPFTWTLAGNPAGSGAAAGSTLLVTGPDVGGCLPPMTWFETVAPVAGLVSVVAEFQNLDSGVAQGHPIYDAPAGWRNGQVLTAPPVGPGSQDGWPSGTYTIVFAVEAGDTFGFGVWSADCTGGPGIAEFHDLDLTPQAWSGQPLALDPRLGFEVTGETLLSFPASLAAAGDVDGDGVPDVAAAQAGLATILAGDAGGPVLVLPGLSPYDTSVAGAGDVDGDGHADVLVGSPYSSDAGPTYAGAARLCSGLDGSTLHTWLGSATSDNLGAVVAGLGDADGDGVGDVAIRVPKLGSTPDIVLLASGATGAVLHSITAPVLFADFGAHLAGAGDVDGDGLGDVIVGADDRAWVYSGVTGSVLHVLGGNLGDEVAVAGAGDVDADGHADLVLGAPRFKAGGGAVGRLLVCSGASGATLLGLNGSQVDGRFGHAVAGGGDHDGDGRLDVAASAPGQGLGGLVRVVDALDGTPVALLLASFEGDGLGDQLARPGDVDGDLRDDLAVGTAQAGVDDDGLLRLYRRLDHPGAPRLEGEGALAAGTPVTISVENALANQPVFLVLGGSFAPLPLLGGMLGPSPDVVVPLLTDTSGALQLAGTWPAGLPAWFTVWMQAWAVDAAGPKGWSATDALAASQL